MRAEIPSRIVSATRAAAVLLIVLILAGCKTEKDPDPATVLGNPPETAYLGVEYFYNFGAYGGEGILDYSLTNAPSWLALEDINNKARQGVIMRGVPGLTGGGRGEADLGITQDVTLLTTDGRMVGFRPFNINVKHNQLSLESETFAEGAGPELPAELEQGQCEIPELDRNGEHSISYNEYAEDGSVVAVRQAILPTRPVLVRVLLDRPSVTEINVAFELDSNFDSSNCDDGFAEPHQRCDQGTSNKDDSSIGQDVVALGSGSGSLLPEVEYLTYETDGSGAATSGVVTLAPGTTECFIRLEVIEDGFPEEKEQFTVRLTEVRSGLASLGRRSVYAKAMSIEDNEPVVTLQTLKGGDRDTLNTGQFQEYSAVLTGKHNAPITARLTSTPGATAVSGSDFTTQLQSPSGLWEAANELQFPVGTNELSFRVQVNEPPSFSNSSADDKFISLTIDKAYQAGRPNHARANDEAPLRISVNELQSAVLVNETGAESFLPTDISVEQNGNIFVAGYEPQNGNRISVRILDRLGGLFQEIEIAPSGSGLVVENGIGPVLATSERYIRGASAGISGQEQPLYELGVAYNVEAGQQADVVAVKYSFDSDSNGGEYLRNWEIRTGTSGTDLVQAMDINSSGQLVLAGVTDGAWPEELPAGNFDSFVQIIESTLDGQAEKPQVSWTRQLGYSGDEYVAGVSSNESVPLVYGWSSDLEGGPNAIGEPGAFFYSTSSLASNITVNQIATELDDRIIAGVSSGTDIWLLGNGTTEYNRTDEQNGAAPSFERNALGSSAGFVLGGTRFGNVTRAFTVNDQQDNQADRFVAIDLFDNDLVVAGKTEGEFAPGAVVSGQHGAIARLSLDATDDLDSSEFDSSWRYQVAAGDSEIVDLANYRDDEITALVRFGNNWNILLFGPQGDLLNP
ncbi:hypothetical protein LPB19_12665 [Marinobacter salinisoli]|uniref:Uncharacterized protein n=1 Tax=Marinobacter salinisoli TaxID=2769486 RepID=A0ABX7MRJ4_9GAMM|nr:hypothetical protein [Marinobacter salinisoli]QSP94040.1 hypothetical protein LPB19_12665 [Marinobacter salinisoli]